MGSSGGGWGYAEEGKKEGLENRSRFWVCGDSWRFGLVLVGSCCLSASIVVKWIETEDVARYAEEGVALWEGWDNRDGGGFWLSGGALSMSALWQSLWCSRYYLRVSGVTPSLPASLDYPEWVTSGIVQVSSKLTNRPEEKQMTAHSKYASAQSADSLCPQFQLLSRQFQHETGLCGLPGDQINARTCRVKELPPAAGSEDGITRTLLGSECAQFWQGNIGFTGTPQCIPHCLQTPL